MPLNTTIVNSLFYTSVGSTDWYPSFSHLGPLSPSASLPLPSRSRLRCPRSRSRSRSRSRVGGPLRLPRSPRSSWSSLFLRRLRSRERDRLSFRTSAATISRSDICIGERPRGLHLCVRAADCPAVDGFCFDHELRVHLFGRGLDRQWQAYHRVFRLLCDHALLVLPRLLDLGS